MAYTGGAAMDTLALRARLAAGVRRGTFYTARVLHTTVPASVDPRNVLTSVLTPGTAPSATASADGSVFLHGILLLHLCDA